MNSFTSYLAFLTFVIPFSSSESELPEDLLRLLVFYLDLVTLLLEVWAKDPDTFESSTLTVLSSSFSLISSLTCSSAFLDAA
jgi:hypothetical protein